MNNLPGSTRRFRGSNVVEVLERAGRTLGFPAIIQVDRDTEFISRNLHAVLKSIAYDRETGQHA